MESIWTPGLITNLAKLWDEGHSTAEIGRRLGISRNSVIGKAHRLALSPRPSPLKRPPIRRLPESYLSPAGRCQWPVEGGPYKKCGEQTVKGKPYCEAHCKASYVKSIHQP